MDKQPNAGTGTLCVARKDGHALMSSDFNGFGNRASRTEVSDPVDLGPTTHSRLKDGTRLATVCM